MLLRKIFLRILIIGSWLGWGYFVYISLFQHSFNPSMGWEIDKGAMIINRVKYRDVSGQPIVPEQDRLKKGDRILELRGDRGLRREIHGLFDFGEVVRYVHPGDHLTITVERPNGSRTTRLEFPVDVIPPAWTLLSWLMLIGLLAPMVAILAATLIGFLKPDDPNAFWASLLFLCFNTVFQQPAFVFPPGLREAASFTTGLLNAIFVFVLMRFFLSFPSPSLIDRRVPWLKKAFLAITLLWLIPAMFGRYALDHSFHLLQRIPGWVETIASLASIAMFLVAIASLILNTIKAQGRDERRRMNILLGGSLAGLLPTFIFILYFSLFNSSSPPLWIVLIIVVTLCLFPLSFIYAVVKHRVLGIRVILRQGLKYTLVSKGFLVLEGAVIFSIAGFTSQTLLLDRFPNLTPNWIAVIAAFLAVLGMAGLREINRRIFPAIDRRFFREAYNAHKILIDLRRSVRQLASQPDQLLRLVVENIGNSLHPGKAAIFLRGMKYATAQAAWESPAKDMGDVALGETDFHSSFVYHIPSSSSRLLASPDQAEAMTLPGRSFMARHLEKLATEEPVALEVYLDDPKSWVQALVKDSTAAAHAYEERLLLEKLNTRLIVPLIAGQQVLGFISLGEKLSEEPYSKEDQELLLTLAEQVAVALDYVRLIKKVAEQEKLKRELEIAQEVQAKLFPQALPPLPTLDYTGICRAARGVGGDYYDFLLLEPGKLGLALGDISGKGIAAALLMAGLQASLRSHAPLRGDNLGELVGDLNRLMCASVDGSKYATFFYCVYDEDSRRLTYVNAGHNPPLLFQKSLPPAPAVSAMPKEGEDSLSLVPPSPPLNVQRLEPSGMVIGLFQEARYEEQVVPLSPGDVLVIYSDGVTEAMNEREEEFGENRLMELVARHCHLNSEEILQLLLAEISRFVGSAAQHDDMTLVIAKVRP